MKQALGIPMGIDSAPFWANLFLYSYEEEYISLLISPDKIKARHSHLTKRFIDDLCATNDGGEFERCICDTKSHAEVVVAKGRPNQLQLARQKNFFW